MRNLKAMGGALALVLILSGAAMASLVTEEDQKLIEAANCDEIVKEYHNFSAAEKELAAEIRSAENSEVAGNVIGAASLAVFGLGFFSWDDNTDAKGNLAELTAYRQAIEAEGRKKNCAL